MTNYKRGYNFEIRIRNKFRDHGYQAERKAASSPYDLMVMKDGRIVFIADAKKTGQRDKDHIYVRKESIESVIEEAEKLGTEPLILYGFYRSPIYVALAEDIVDKGGKTVRLEESTKLDDLLDNFKM
ncbi:MAG: hypothetical protein ACLFS3_02075 [Candidatus Aenigmatarchaeota archaeon]